MEQDQPVDIVSISREPDPTQGGVDQAYDDFISLEPDGDDDEAFYPPPEFEADCEWSQRARLGAVTELTVPFGCLCADQQEPEPPEQDLDPDAAAKRVDESGFASEELAVPAEETKPAKATKAGPKKKPAKRAKLAKSEEL